MRLCESSEMLFQKGGGGRVQHLPKCFGALFKGALFQDFAMLPSKEVFIFGKNVLGGWSFIQGPD